MVPFDQKSPLVTSGIRIGTPAMTTRGMKENEMSLIAELIHRTLSDIENENVISDVNYEVVELCGHFPIYKELR
jgi:glycine hydroxymethyltransferase